MEVAPAPPAYAPPPVMVAAPKRGGRGPLIAILLVVALLVVGGGGYAVGGFLYGNGKVNASIDAYNKVADHQNKLADHFNKLNSQFNKNNLASETSDSVKQEKALFQQLVTESQSFQPTVASDDKSMADSKASLQENAWLTVLSKSSIDTQVNKIDHVRAALAIAKTILADYIQYGTFYESADAAVIDVDTLASALDNDDIQGAVTANKTLQADVATAISLDKAPGVAPEWSGFLTDLQNVSRDFSNLVAAAEAGDAAGIDSASNAYDSDTHKLDAYDFTNMSNEEQGFYKNLIDSYNAEVDKLNA
jgi:hypothetical protein